MQAYKELYDPDQSPEHTDHRHGAPSTVIQRHRAVARVVKKTVSAPAQGKDLLSCCTRCRSQFAIDDAEVLAHLVAAVGNVRPDTLQR